MVTQQIHRHKYQINSIHNYSNIINNKINLYKFILLTIQDIMIVLEYIVYYLMPIFIIESLIKYNIPNLYLLLILIWYKHHIMIYMQYLDNLLEALNIYKKSLIRLYKLQLLLSLKLNNHKININMQLIDWRCIWSIYINKLVMHSLRQFKNSLYSNWRINVKEISKKDLKYLIMLN